MKNILLLSFLMIPAFFINASSQSTDTLRTRKFSIGINFSPDYSYRRLYLEDDEFGFVEHRNETESPRFGFTTGLTASYHLNSRFALESGLQFSDKGDKYEASKEDFYYGDGFYIEDDPAIPDNWKTISHYYYLGIPLKLNYYVLQKGVKLFFSAGFSTDFYVGNQLKTTWEFSDRTERDTNKMETEDFNKVNITGLAGFGIEADISKRVRFRFEPIFRYSFTPIIDATMKGYLYSIGANVALFYR